jgi:hypothetical protein
VTQDQIPRLLDAAVPPVPVRLLRLPYEGIRRRVRRNRTLRVGAAAALAVVAATVGVVVAVGPFRGPSTVVGLAPTADPVTPRSLRVAQVDRAGTGLTLYVNPSREQCRTFADAIATIDEGVNDVVVSITGDGRPTECERPMAAPIRATLAQPLGDRTLWSDGAVVRVFYDADLPEVPSPWHEVPVEFSELDGRFFDYGYTRPGGPELDFRAVAGTPPGAGLGERVALGSRQGTIVTGGDQNVVMWQVRDVTYILTLHPRERLTGSVDELHAVIAQLTWP